MWNVAMDCFDMTQQDCREEIYEDGQNYPYPILMRTE